MTFLIALFALAAVASATEQAPIAIVRQSTDVQADGHYQWTFETENGISASEQGEPRIQGEESPAVAAQGQFAYTAPDGTPIQLTYVADENGFQPQGAHLPVAPPVPKAIVKAIEYNLAHPEQNKE
ncbi:endocuticle structural glycoprotein SgAbd-1-like [Phymastichus coffea]|uniref:endocuticle structural glycoprotein SgAbd-1-like n=1 Tax=Phymastichus coffea TaxID=108790 RepID=UPI00273C98D8|nr:endocuticle structural glycoprotein SgAbd-1-like [Phymastichus coffea]